ncbi:hypothetical protein [Gordonia shandongensis]|uniref:hypothetical protein n=1 Tax=Gordonia shandongensis TaxID=376351 RepID=UPI00047C2D6D|nr:hypothetical protein [Gordonia shandongensis]
MDGSVFGGAPVVAFTRRPRLVTTAPPDGEVELTAPPELSRAVPPNMLVRLLPVVMVVAVVGANVGEPL